MNYTLPKEKLSSQIEIWKKKYQVFIPVNKDGNLIWQESSSPNPQVKPIVTHLSIKKFFLPSNEILFKFISKKTKTTNNIQPFILLGVPKCDIDALKLLDKIFNCDPYYQKRRKQAIIIGMGTQVPQGGFDIFLEEFNKYYKVYTNNKQLILKKLYTLSTINKSKTIINNIDPLFADPEKLSNALKKSINDKLWDKLTDICFGCGTCAYVCPLCYCFKIEDSVDLDKKLCPTSCQLCSGQRTRMWDSCFLAHFSEVATNHNFRPKLKNRIYNWYHHKFVRFPQEYGQVGCVNCGRCIKYCPAKINYRKVLEEVLVKYS